MRHILVLFMFVLAIVPANAEEESCFIGKPSYCFKYGGTRCEENTTVPNKTAACSEWTDSCLACHAEIPRCLGRNERTSISAALCDICRTKWTACMKEIHRHLE